MIQKSINKKIVAAREVSQPKDIVYQSAPKRPTELPCEIHRSKIGGEDWSIFVGLLNGKPYEIFGGKSDKVELPKKYREGKLRKRSFKNNGKYDLILDEGEDEWKIKDIVTMFDNPNYGLFTRMLSTPLRHGVHVQYICDQLLKDRDADLFSFSKVMARVLKKYIPDGTKATKGCPQCGSSNVQYQQNCPKCLDCQWSKCD